MIKKPHLSKKNMMNKIHPLKTHGAYLVDKDEAFFLCIGIENMELRIMKFLSIVMIYKQTFKSIIEVRMLICS